MNCGKSLISVVVPVYNEEKIIKIFLDELIKSLTKLDYSYEIIIVDDGSSDKTLDIIKNSQESCSAIRLLSFTRNFGHQFALIAGLERAQGSAIIMMDSDLQHPPSLISELVKLWESGFLVVQTIRHDNNLSFFKRISSKLFYSFINLLAEIKIFAGTADFRLIDRSVAKELLKFKESDIFLRGIIPWLGFKTTFLNFTATPRYGGKSKYSVLKMIKFALSGITSLSTLPLKLTIYAGFLISLLSFYFGIRSIIIKIFTHQTVSGWASIIVGIFFLGGLALIFLGVIGEYIGKMFLEVKKRPRFIIKEEAGFDN